MKTATPIASRKALIHGIAECKDCDWREENYLVVQKCAARHAKMTGHRVTVELGYVMKYNAPRKNNDE